jgi:flagellar basal body-associated protein FliL
MNKLLVVTVVVVMVSGLVGATTMMGLSDSYTTKQSKQVPPENPKSVTRYVLLRANLSRMTWEI